MIPGYGKVYAVGHRAVRDIFSGPVQVEEKVDGSQFSFGVIDGKLQCRSKGQAIDPGSPEKLFLPAVETVMRLYLDGKLNEGWIYRGETLAKRKHNKLQYDDVPGGNIMIFDIDRGVQDMLDVNERMWESHNLGLSVVPVFFEGVVEDFEQLKEFLERESFLGGTKIEGFVVKNYNRFTEQGGHAMKAKYVSEKFKEVHTKDWRRRHPTKKDILDEIADGLRTEARWEKAVQHMREAGTLQEAPEDIGPLMKAVNQDVLEECVDEIKDALWKWAWKNISRKLTRGLPEWYKAKLAEACFLPGQEKDE